MAYIPRGGARGGGDRGGRGGFGGGRGGDRGGRGGFSRGGGGGRGQFHIPAIRFSIEDLESLSSHLQLRKDYETKSS
jgi:hypothetical protein